MKSYLSLITLSAKVCRRQNKMTILCIILAVFLVTGIFSVADMMIRTEAGLMVEKHGNWHMKIEDIPQDVIKAIGGRSDVAAIGASSVFDHEGSEPYQIDGKKAVLYGTEETYIDRISNGIAEGTFPENDNEVMLSPNAVAAFHAQIGDTVTLDTPSGAVQFTVSGFGTEDKKYYEDQTYLIGVYMTQEAFALLMEKNGVTDLTSAYYVQFQDAAKAASAISEIQSQYQLPKEHISENTGVMALTGQSKNASMKNFYGIAAVLFVLVSLAGVLMISGSMNSDISQRTQFFGMMRCIGASRGQIVRFVRLEALNWCKTAIPLGVVLGTVVSWGICAALRYGIGGEFATTPVFKISPIGLSSGVVVGIVTVLLAAQAPARRASRVSPISAVSGNAENKVFSHRTLKKRVWKIERALGIHHATSSKKNLSLMTASFALSIILFLSFSVILDMARLLMPSQAPTSADLVLASYGNEMAIDRSIVDEIREIKGVANVYGVNYRNSVQAASTGDDIDHINIVSYDDTLLDHAEKSIAQGDLGEIHGDSDKVATVFNKENPIQVGDRIQIGDLEVEVTCALTQGLFGDDLIVICSQETWDRLFGKENYGLVGVQLGKDATEETVAQLRQFEDGQIVVTDQRSDNQEGNATYHASRIVAYGFLALIGIITLFNIVNSISMSVSARIKQYGIMRAVGMEERQLIRMIFWESITYAAPGLFFGFGIGIFLSRFLYILTITRHFGLEWHFPMVSSGIMIVFIFVSVVAAVYPPAKRSRDMTITDTINSM